ncbi:MAG: TRAP transporter small permease subunit [Pseudomonadota bacterium]|nr:MAG: TRAP transporter small permease subunit [Pseudomonadota bacterium]
MELLDRLAGRLESLSEWSGRAVAWMTLAMVAITFAVVVLRYMFDTGWIAMQESITYLHSLVFLIGAAYTLRHDAHVRVDIFYRKMGERGRAWVDLIGSLVLLLPVCAYILWSSWDYVTGSWAIRESSPEAGGLPWVYLLKTTLLVAPALLILQGAARAARCALFLGGYGAAPTPAPPDEASREL